MPSTTDIVPSLIAHIFDEESVKSVLNALAKNVTIASPAQIERAGQAACVSLLGVPASIPVPALHSDLDVRVPSLTLQIPSRVTASGAVSTVFDAMTKDVALAADGWPNTPAVPLAQQGISRFVPSTVDALGFAGTIGRLEVKIPGINSTIPAFSVATPALDIPVPTVLTLSVPVTPKVTWKIYTDAACTTEATKDDSIGPDADVLGGTVLIKPEIEELTTAPLTALKSRYVRATLNLSVQLEQQSAASSPPAVTSITVKSADFTTPPVRVVTPPLALPSLLVCFDKPEMDNAALLVVPANSPFATANGPLDVLQKLRLLTAQTDGLARWFGLSAIATLVDALQGLNRLTLVATSAIPDLGAIVLYSHPIDLPPGFAEVRANDQFTTLKLLSGGASVRLFNRADYIPFPYIGFNGGAFTMVTGILKPGNLSEDDVVATIADLSNLPGSDPPVRDLILPTEKVTFYRHLTSLMWL